MSDPITKFTGDFEFMSNFSGAPITDATGRIWPTAEHLFQAYKTCDPAQIEMIRLKTTPGQAKTAGKKVTLRPHWGAVKVAVMREVIAAKFDQHPELRAKLVATGDRQLVEGNTWNDTFWGQCRGKGLNHLGEILMLTREWYQTHPE